jgi:hypothetical protein
MTTMAVKLVEHTITDVVVAAGGMNQPVIRAVA